MNIIFNILRQPLVKLFAVILILYFGLFYDKTNPDSLGNRLAPERLRKDFNEVQEKTFFIVSNLKEAKELNAKKETTEKKDAEKQQPEEQAAELPLQK